MSSTQSNTEIMVVKQRKPRGPNKTKVIIEEDPVQKPQDGITEIETGFAESEVSELSSIEEEVVNIDVDAEIEIHTKKLAELKALKEYQKKREMLLGRGVEMTLECVKQINTKALEIDADIAVLVAKKTELLKDAEEITQIANIDADGKTENAEEIMSWFCEKYPTFGNEFLGLTGEEEKPKNTQKKPKTEKPATEKKKRTHNDLKKKFEEIPDGTRFIMNFKKSGLIYVKKDGKLIGEEDGLSYNSFNNIIRKFKEQNGDTTSFGNAWKLFDKID